MPNGFKGRHFPADFILLCVRCYLKFNVSYRHLAEMMQGRGFEVHHTTIYRWIQTYAPQLEKLIRWYQGHTGCSRTLTPLLIPGEYGVVSRSPEHANEQ
jgi:transposase-like protein